MPQTNNFMFEVEVKVETEEGTLIIANRNTESECTEIHFDSEFTSDPNPSQTTIDIYNLSRETINRFKKGQKVTLSAGFRGDTGVVTNGTIKYIHPPVYSDGDMMFEIVVYEGEDYSKDKREFTDEKDEKLKSNQIQVTFAAGVSARYVLETLSARANIKLDIVSLRNNKNYDEAYSASGKPIDCMQEVTEYTDSKLYYFKGKLIAKDVRSGSDPAFNLSSDTGLLESPQKEEDDNFEGFSIKMVFDHRVGTGVIIDLHDQWVQGRFRVYSGNQSYDGLKAETNIEIQAE